jgi:tyrosine-protein kinase Etk/Wzc
MSSVFDEYTEYLQTNLSRSGQLGLTQEIGGITKECNVLANKIFSIDLELDRLVRMEVDQKAFVPMDDTPFSRSLKDTLSAISELKQQRDLIELSLPSQSRALNELQYENKKGELKEVRDQLCAMQRLLDGIEKHTPLSQDALFDMGEYLGSWAGRLADSKEEDREGLAEYLENAVRLLSMQEKMVQEQIHYAHDTPAAFKGIDLMTARALFLEYYKKLDQIAEGVSHFSRLADEIERGDFEISSLSAVLLDPLSQRLIQQASEIALKLKDVKHHSEKEGSRWAEELSLQKKILKEHLDQLFKLEQVKSDLVQNRIDALQAIRLGSISGQISVLQERLADSVKERKTALLKEKVILEEKMRQILNGLTDIPERWRREKWLNLKSQMGIKMVQGLTELVESKTISSHLHHVESKPLDIATLPTTPCSPGLLVKAILGAMLAGFFVFSRAFLAAVLKGFPSTKEKLCAMGYPVLGEISTVCDGPGTEPRGADLEALRQIFLFLDKEPKVKVVGLIEGKGPDYSFALAEHFSRMSLRPLIIRCDFNMKFNPEDLPGFLQVWKEEISSPPLKRKQGYDLLASGGFTPYGVEVIRSLAFQNSLDKFKKEYDFVLMVFRSPLNLTDSLAPLSLCDHAIVTVSGEPTEQLTPFIDWAYHENMCRLAILTASSP